MSELEPNWFKEPGPEDTGWEGRCNAVKRNAAVRGLHERCKLPAGWRTSHEGLGPCRFHAGNAPGVKAKYGKVQAQQLLHGYGLLREGVVDPRDALMEELRRTLGNIDYLTLVLGDLSEDELLGVVPLPETLKTGESDEKGPYHELQERFGLPALVALYQWERAHLAKLSAEAVKLGLLERQVRVEEAQAALVAAAVNAELELLGFSPAQLEAVKASLVTRLLSLETKAG